MQIYYCQDAAENAVVSLDESESQHVAKVMRMDVGDALQVCDGNGHVFNATVMQVNKKRVSLQVNDCVERQEKNLQNLSIAIAPTKNINRFEWFLEKATEIGVRDIYPFVSDNSERKIIKPERLEKIIISAMKQSKHLYKPELKPLVSFSELIVNCEIEGKFLAYCEDLPEAQFIKELNSDKHSIILIGPEGDFTSEEVEKAKAANFQAVALGFSRLRTETAGIVAAQIAQDVNLIS